MERMNVYVWWSGGRMEGGGYDAEIELTDEQFELLENILEEEDMYDHDINEIEDPRLKGILQEYRNKLTDDLIDSSLEYLKEEYDESGGSAEWPDMRQWFKNRYSYGVRFE